MVVSHQKIFVYIDCYVKENYQPKVTYFQFANNDFKSYCENIIILKVKPNVDDMNLFQCHNPTFGRV